MVSVVVVVGGGVGAGVSSGEGGAWRLEKRVTVDQMVLVAVLVRMVEVVVDQDVRVDLVVL